jgi:nucleoside phosphorylase
MEVVAMNDNNTYVFGRLGPHYVVVSCLPIGKVGLVSAANVAKDMTRSFPSLKFALMVGIGGGAPMKKRDIRLGDVIVSAPGGG